MLRSIKRISADLRHLVFPDACLSCSCELSREEKHLCTECLTTLPITNMERFEGDATPLEKLFWGRIPLVFAYAHLFFQKKGASQKILFNIKYTNNKHLAVFLGENIGSVLKDSMEKTKVDLLIPVPLHHRKKFIRGYNQSEELGKGISSTSGVNMRTDLILRRRFTETQTKKSRFERWGNLDNAFQVSQDIQSYQHLVLVDDVATTGATIEQLVLEIRKVHPEVQLSVVTLALA